MTYITAESIAYFNPQAPRGARRTALHHCVGTYVISIHRLLAEPDAEWNYTFRVYAYFNPQAPRGARRTKSRKNSPEGNFNPQAPRGARPELLTE